MKTGFYNGYIYDPDDDTFHSSLIIENNSIISIDNDLKLKECENIINLKKRMLLPSFIDTHLHLDEIGIYLNSLNLKDISSVNELKQKLKNYRKIHTGHIFGFGWDDEKLGMWPSYKDIDGNDDVYILLARNDLHSGLINKKLEEDAKLNSEKGIVKEREFERAREFLIKNYDYNTVRKYLMDSMDYLLSFGITTAGYMSCYGKWCEILKDMDSRGILKMRIFSYLNFDEIIKRNSLYVGKYYREYGLKVYADGSLGSRTAFLTFGYSDDPGNKGIRIIDNKDMFLDVCNKFDCDLAVHAIGDGAMDIILEMSKYYKKFRIEHASVVRDDQIKRMKNLRISVQPGFILTDFWIDKRIGENNIRLAYRIKDLAENNMISFSSDAPVEIPDPLRNIYASIFRGFKEKLPISKTYQNISLRDALRFHISNGAKFFNIKAGKLEEGYFADMVILNKNIFENENEILNLRVENVYFDGFSLNSHH
ncbi:MAG: amidohydrolase [Thermoplasmata archaeon]